MDSHRIRLSTPAPMSRSAQSSTRCCAPAAARNSSTIAQTPRTHGMDWIQPSTNAKAAVRREPCCHSSSNNASPNIASTATWAPTAMGYVAATSVASHIALSVNPTVQEVATRVPSAGPARRYGTVTLRLLLGIVGKEGDLDEGVAEACAL